MWIIKKQGIASNFQDQQLSAKFADTYPKLKANGKIFWGVATMIRFIIRIRIRARNSKNVNYFFLSKKTKTAILF